MPGPNRRKRSYGYVAPESEDDEPDISRHSRKQREGWFWRSIGSLITLPFRLAWWIIKLPFTLIGGKNGRGRSEGIGKKVLLKTVIYGFGFLFLAGVSLVVWASQDLPDPNKLNERQFAQSTKIFDRTGEYLIYEIFTDQKRTIVELADIPVYLVRGVIATEDTKFYEHRGIRPLSILRAFAVGVFTNKKIAGTSTLTQQLVKNAILTNERSLVRKIKEAVLSIWLEQKYTKEEILKIYFNEIPYGSTNYGVESAAQDYFGKHVTDLNLAEAATLAGMPQKPSVYLNNPEALKNKRNFVLQRMVDENYLSQEEADKTMLEPLNLNRRVNTGSALHFVQYVKQQLVEKYGENTVDKGGLKVITTLDWDKQQTAEKTIADLGKTLLDQGGADNAAILALDPRNGQILAMVGSRDYNDVSIGGNFNVAVDSRRQPGSSIKPIIYAAAFEKGFTPGTIIYDVITPFSGGGDKSYTPQNYDLGERGPVTMRQALQGSLNIPAVKTLYLVGLKKGIEFAERLGYSTLSTGNFGLSLVLGGGEVSMLEHVNAYAVFAANGKKFVNVAILKVEDNKGTSLFEWKETEGEQVIDPKVAATITNVLSDDAARAFVFGAGGTLTLPGRPVAAKTGTTNKYIDAWQVGYTPSLAVGVWAGNSDNSPMKKGYGGSKVAGQIWNLFMKEVLKGAPVETFPSMPAITTDKPILNGKTGGSITLRVDRITGKIATTSTPEGYIEERTYIPPHDTLFYVDKDNPQGPAPTNPENDPMYQSWEAAVIDWIARKKAKEPDWKVSFDAPPTEYDDVHSLELIPTVEIIAPTDGQVFFSRQIDSDIKVSATRGVAKVAYKIDGVYVGVVNEFPFNLHYFANTMEPGEHILTALVSDDVGNEVSKEVRFTLNAPAVKPGFFFNSPPPTISRENFPVSLLLNPYKIELVSEIRIVAENITTKEKITVATVSDFSKMFNNQLSVVWSTAPVSGLWELAVEAKLKNGETVRSDTRTVEVK
ncbi:MAG: PBP1A family penicillin-binding protein [Patescibacteria group bacterium]